MICDWLMFQRFNQWRPSLQNFDAILSVYIFPRRSASKQSTFLPVCIPSVIFAQSQNTSLATDKSMECGDIDIDLVHQTGQKLACEYASRSDTIQKGLTSCH